MVDVSSAGGADKKELKERLAGAERLYTNEELAGMQGQATIFRYGLAPTPF